MKLCILYRPNTEYWRLIEEYSHDFHARYPDKQIELISLDTVEGSNLAELYDIIQYPAVLALDNEGKLLKHWQGETLPLMDELLPYAGAAI